MTGGCPYIIRPREGRPACATRETHACVIVQLCSPGADYCTASSEQKRLAGIEVAATMKSEEKTCIGEERE